MVKAIKWPAEGLHEHSSDQSPIGGTQSEDICIIANHDGVDLDAQNVCAK